MRGFEVVVTRELPLAVAVALVTSEVVVSRATPAREGRAIARAASMLGMGRERALFLCRA
jgi:hypothetical protein